MRSKGSFCYLLRLYLTILALRELSLGVLALWLRLRVDLDFGS